MYHFTLHRTESWLVCCLILAAVKEIEGKCSIEAIVSAGTGVVTENSGNGRQLSA